MTPDKPILDVLDERERLRETARENQSDVNKWIAYRDYEALTGEQVDAALRRAIDALKIYAGLTDVPRSWSGRVVQDFSGPARALLREFGVKLED